MVRRAPEITDRDRPVLELLAEHRFAVTSHVAALLDVTDQTARRRLARLDQLRHVESRPIFEGCPHPWRITRRGLAAVGSDLPPPPRRIDPSSYQHEVGLAWLWLAARAGRFGALARIDSDRAMRSRDRRHDRGGRRIGIGIGAVARNGREQLHYPDLILTTTAGKRVAFELELTRKSDSRLDAIMLGYAGDGRIDGAVYLIPARERRLIEAVQRAVRRAEISDLVRVQPLAGPPRGAPDLRRAPDRRPARTQRRAIAVGGPGR